MNLFAFKSIQESFAIFNQTEIFEMAGANIETEMETVGQYIDFRREKITGLDHQLTGHFHNQPALFGERNKLVRRHQTDVRVLPAHQDFATSHVVMGAINHRLAIRNELSVDDAGLHDSQRRTNAAEQHKGHHTDKNTQQREQEQAGGRVFEDIMPMADVMNRQRDLIRIMARGEVNPVTFHLIRLWMNLAQMVHPLVSDAY